jgi:hypothetical protein
MSKSFLSKPSVIGMLSLSDLSPGTISGEADKRIATAA